METVSCIICRRRKIKCDRRPVTCINCAKFGTPCSYPVDLGATSASESGVGDRPTSPIVTPPASASATTTQAGLQRRRILRSCTACKQAKAKCSGGARCSRCTRRSIACVYEGGRRVAKARDKARPESEVTTGASAASQDGTIRPRPSVARHGSEDASENFPSPVSVKHETAEMRASLPTSSFPSSSSPAPSITSVSSAPGSNAIPAWLASANLPNMDRLRGLIDSYFARIHPLRCLGFLHMPTFLERLRDPQALYADEYGLVHAICALAAPFQYAETMSMASASTGTVCRFYDAGSGWASTAMQRIFHHLGTPDVESLMTEMLVHEYYLRSGEYAKAFMLSGVVARHVQVLQLNLEHDCNSPSQRRGAAGTLDGSTAGSTLSWATKESRRRLVWCCFLQDAFMECGIDQLRFINPADIQVQLPCTEELFVRSRPCITEMLTPGKLLPFAVDPDAESAPLAGADASPSTSRGASNLDLRAFYIRAMAIRAKVLKYVKNLQGDIPWSADPQQSQFTRLDRELRDLEASVPEELRMNPENTCVFRWSGWSGSGGSGRLGLYFGVHILLAQTFNDLYRVGVANLVFPHNATLWIRTNAPIDFLVRCHQMCSTKAVAIATLLEELWQTDKLSLVDTPYAMHAQVCSSVLVMTMISWQSLCNRRGMNGPSGSGAAPVPVDPRLVPTFLPHHRRLLQSNMVILDFLRTYIKADLYYESARQVLRRFEHHEAIAGAEDAQSTVSSSSSSLADGTSGTTDAPQFSLEYILNPLGVYPMARQQARNRHEPEAIVPPAHEPLPGGSNVPINMTNPPNTAAPSMQRVPIMESTHSAQHNPHSMQGIQSTPPVLIGMQGPADMMARNSNVAEIAPPGYYQQRPAMAMYDAPPALMEAPGSNNMGMGGPMGTTDAADAGESSLFQMWDWESEVPSMDNMGYPTFLEPFSVTN